EHDLLVERQPLLPARLALVVRRDRRLDPVAIRAELVVGDRRVPGLERRAAVEPPAQLVRDLGDRGHAARAVAEVRGLELRRRFERGRRGAVLFRRAARDQPALLRAADAVQPQPLALGQRAAVGDHLLELGLLAAGLLVLRRREAGALALQVADRVPAALEDAEPRVGPR